MFLAGFSARMPRHWKYQEEKERLEFEKSGLERPAEDDLAPDTFVQKMQSMLEKEFWDTFVSADTIAEGKHLEQAILISVWN